MAGGGYTEPLQQRNQGRYSELPSANLSSSTGRPAHRKEHSHIAGHRLSRRRNCARSVTVVAHWRRYSQEVALKSQGHRCLGSHDSLACFLHVDVEDDFLVDLLGA